MNSKPVIIFISVFVALGLIAGACSAGFMVGRASAGNASAITSFPLIPGQSTSTEVTVEAPETLQVQDLDELFVPFWQTWTLVEENFVDRPLDYESMMRGAIRGMLESLGDEHTSYLDPEMFERANA